MRLRLRLRSQCDRVSRSARRSANEMQIEMFGVRMRIHERQRPPQTPCTSCTCIACRVHHFWVLCCAASSSSWSSSSLSSCCQRQHKNTGTKTLEMRDSRALEPVRKTMRCMRRRRRRVAQKNEDNEVIHKIICTHRRCVAVVPSARNGRNRL